MTSVLGQYLREARLALGWSYGDAARALGYLNLSKGARRIQHLEDGVGDVYFLKRVISVLGLDVEEIRHRNDEDILRQRDEFNEWADQPIDPELLVDVMSGIMARRSLEGAKTQMEIFEKARKTSDQFGDRPTYLVTSRRLTFIFRSGQLVRWEEATPTLPTLLPFTMISGKPCQITLSSAERMILVEHGAART